MHSEASEVSQLFVSLEIPTQTKRSASKKIAVFRQHIIYKLSVADIKNCMTGIPNFPFYHDLKPCPIDLQTCVSQIRKLLPQYERLVTEKCKFPAGGESDPLLLERHARVLESSDFWVKTELIQVKSPSENVQDTIENRYRLLEVC